MAVQDHSAQAVHRWLAGDDSPDALLDELDELYQQSEPAERSNLTVT
jgi:hypothetical protein